MKKLGTVLAACCLGLAMTACGTNTPDATGSGAPADTTAPITNDSITKDTGSVVPDSGSAVGSGSAVNTSDPNTRSFGDCTVSILDYSIRPDSEGEPALRVTYEFTNNSKKKCFLQHNSCSQCVSKKFSGSRGKQQAVFSAVCKAVRAG